jgi:uncharacterized protein (DUF952 family)
MYLLAIASVMLFCMNLNAAETSQNEIPEFLYKIVSPEQWKESQEKGHLVLTAMDADFIHLSTEDQVEHVIKKFWKDSRYLILKLDSKKLKGDLKYETNPGGTTKYYHLYDGSIPLDAVVGNFSSIESNS